MVRLPRHRRRARSSQPQVTDRTQIREFDGGRRESYETVCRPAGMILQIENGVSPATAKAVAAAGAADSMPRDITAVSSAGMEAQRFSH